MNIEKRALVELLQKLKTNLISRGKMDYEIGLLEGIIEVLNSAKEIN